MRAAASSAASTAGVRYRVDASFVRAPFVRRRVNGCFERRRIGLEEEG